MPKSLTKVPELPELVELDELVVLAVVVGGLGASPTKPPLLLELLELVDDVGVEPPLPHWPCGSVALEPAAAVLTDSEACGDAST